MISKETVIDYIKRAMPDAEVILTDKTGTMDHYRLEVISEKFQTMNLLDRQRFVYEALNEPMKDGRIHALEIRSRTPEEAVK